MTRAEVKRRGSLANGWGAQSEQRFEQTFVRAPDGARAFTDSAAQWLGVLHLSASDSLRAPAQSALFEHRAAAAAALAAGRLRTRTASLVWQHRTGLGRSFALGATRQRGEPGGTRADELFAKVAISF